MNGVLWENDDSTPPVYLDMPWGRLGFRHVRGGGLPWIFLHGTGCDSEYWGEVMAALPAGREYVRIDFRGHGVSSVPDAAFTLSDLADDVAVVMRHLGLERAMLVGHSLGGMVSLDVARRVPSVAGLVLLEGWSHLEAAGIAFSGERMFGALTPEQAEMIETKSRRTRTRFSPDVWERFWRSVRLFDGRPFLRQARIPVWSVYGGKGRNASTEHRLSIPANPFVRVVWVDGAGHYLPLECPRDVARVIQRAGQDVRSTIKVGPECFLA